jgi:hypothetical protein
MAASSRLEPAATLLRRLSLAHHDASPSLTTTPRTRHHDVSHSLTTTPLTRSPTLAASCRLARPQSQDVTSKLSALGNVRAELGAVCEGSLGVLMRDVGLARGAPQPESLAAMLDAATQTVADIKRYATSAMLTPTASPRFRSSASQARAIEAILGGAQGGSTGAASTIAPSEGGGEGDADDGTDGAPKLPTLMTSDDF